MSKKFLNITKREMSNSNINSYKYEELNNHEDRFINTYDMFFVSHQEKLLKKHRRLTNSTVKRLREELRKWITAGKLPK